MFDLGFSELVLVALLALLVLGPKRLPEVARAAGRWVARIRRFVEDVKRDIDREIRDEDLAALRNIHHEISETRDLLEKSTSETLSSLSQTVADDGASTDYALKASAPDVAPAAVGDTKRTTRPKKAVKRKQPVARKKHGKAAKARSR